MKKYILFFLGILTLGILINSCREDGKWEDDPNIYKFTIERDKDFIEKGVGEINQIKYNIKPTYKYEHPAFIHKFKFTSNLKGILKLNGEVLEAHKEYVLENPNNTFEYIGEVSGNHILKTSTTNLKGYSVDEEFSLKYGVSEFTHTFQGGNGDIYQGEPSYYVMKIVPGEGQPTSGYKIKFVSYTGEIKMNDIAVQTNTEYPIQNIDNFKITLTTNQVGNNALYYTISNSTVSKDYNIQQEIKKREILVQSMNISNTNVPPNTALSLIGVIKKSPSTGNTAVQFKTWISDTSNGNISGIQNTNNIYMPYALQNNGSFTYNFNAIEAGNYTYNIQFKDEFGNESEVKSFTIKVENSLSITSPASVSVNLQRTKEMHRVGPGGINTTYLVKHQFNNSILNMGATASPANGIAKVIFQLNFVYDGQTISKEYNYNYPDFPNTVSLSSQNTNDSYELWSGFVGNNPNGKPIEASNGTFTCFVYDKQNNMVKSEGTTIVNIM